MEQISLVQELVSNQSRYTDVSRKQDYKIVGVPGGKKTTETVKCLEG
jgi:hypothetical protein